MIVNASVGFALLAVTRDQREATRTRPGVCALRCGGGLARRRAVDDRPAIALYRFGIEEAVAASRA